MYARPLSFKEVGHRLGFTLIELLVVMSIIAVLIGLLLPALHSSRQAARLTRDATQIQQIHKAWLAHATHDKGRLPTPGLINRQAINGMQIPGRGEETRTFNDTARIHSACIMLQYYNPEICVSTAEASGLVGVKQDYNYDAYNVTADVYWDDTFSANLSVNSNLSYASVPVAAERQRRFWNNTMDANVPIIGNRGVQNGEMQTSAIYNNSRTLEIHGARKRWEGNLCFSDNHIEYIETFFPERVSFQLNGQTVMDNIFRNDSPDGGPSDPDGIDAWLVIINKGHMAGSPNQVIGFAAQWD